MADDHVAGVQAVDQDRADELLGGEARKLERVLHDEHGVQAKLAEGLELVLQPHDQLGRALRPVDLRRMGVERHGDRPGAVHPCGPDELGQHLLVAAVDAVEIADSDNGRTKVVGDLGRIVPDVDHQPRLLLPDRKHVRVPIQAPELSKITRIRPAPRTAAEPAPAVIYRRAGVPDYDAGAAVRRREPAPLPRKSAPPADQKEYALTDIHDLLDQIPVDQIAALLGTDTASAQAAVETAVPTLLAGLQNNAQAPDGAASLESALAQHQDGLTDGGVDATQVDTADGEKIVSHVFGGQQDQVASQLAGTANLGGAGGDLVRRLLPILAPIIMSYLAKKILGGQQGGGPASPLPGGTGAGGAGRRGGAGGAGGIDLGSILGGILGGAAVGPVPEGRAREASGTFLAASWAAASRSKRSRQRRRSPPNRLVKERRRSRRRSAP